MSQSMESYSPDGKVLVYRTGEEDQLAVIPLSGDEAVSKRAQLTT